MSNPVEEPKKQQKEEEEKKAEIEEINDQTRDQTNQEISDINHNMLNNSKQLLAEWDFI